MTSLTVTDFLSDVCDVGEHTLSDYETEVPRWCKGCGDHGVLSTLQRLLLEDQIDPENVVSVSGIGCSSRLPHYLRTYGFHGIHGRALPLSLGVTLARPELRVITVMGDGDCFSIGAGHWLHTLRYNPRMLVLVLDNEVYALTKNQASPTSQKGAVTNTSPYGAYLEGMNPLSVIMGVAGVSFLAQSATWLPLHLEATIRRAWNHNGMAFVRIMQRCPVFMPDLFSGQDAVMRFLQHETGVEVDPLVARRGELVTHDPQDLDAAQKLARVANPMPMGLIYHNPNVPSYGEVRNGRVKKVGSQELISKMDAMLDKYTVQLD